MANRNRSSGIETIFTGTVLVQAKPRVEWRDGLVHFIGEETGIRLAMSRHMFLALHADCAELVEHLETADVVALPQPIFIKELNEH